MRLKTRIFELCSGKCKKLSELARAMGISVSEIYRVREGKRHINHKLIIGALKAFPNYRLDELFYLTPELLSTSPTEVGHSGSGNNGHYKGQSPAP